MDYNSAKEIMEEHATTIAASHGIVGRHNPNIKRLASNTLLSFSERAAEGLPEDRERPVYRVSYFNNPILYFWERDYFTIFDHGWFAKTTHSCLNECLPRGFYVYGDTPRLAMEHRRPLGYIRTPAGVFPYHMPAVFKYDGTPCLMPDSLNSDSVPYLDTALTGNARQVISELGAYTNEYLNRLLHHKEMQVMGRLATEKDWSGIEGIGHLSGLAATAVLQKTYYSHLIELAIADQAHVAYEGLTLQEIVAILLKEGWHPFHGEQTNDERAGKLENIIKLKLPVPHLTKTWIKTRLKPLVNEFIITALGFDHVTWNKR